ncbi:MAG: indole-3-glycerol phosphate synthase TrpC [Gammaproteobacteria bacterium]|nr:indole-3-glycerol phosphate synthase TrpC [Gammaproteobacteria bacterium]
MHNRLTEIIHHKQREVEQLKTQLSINYSDLDSDRVRLLKTRQPHKSLRDTLHQQPGVAIISEIKRRSPSKGNLATISQPTELVKNYVNGGASAISVLTERNFFSGSVNDLQQIAQHLQNHPTPVLRKDFIIDRLQIIESLLYGADAILLIVAVLQQQTAELLDFAKALNIDVIVEVHNRAELDIAVASGAEIIGVNNRNLQTFAVDLNTSLTLAAEIPTSITKIAESGIQSVDDIKKIHAAGFDAALIGEALVKHPDPTLFIQQMREVA